MRLTPRPEARLLDFLLTDPAARLALWPNPRPVRYFGRCSGCGEYAECMEGEGARYCERCRSQTT
jgi:hypothetical protein